MLFSPNFFFFLTVPYESSLTAPPLQQFQLLNGLFTVFIVLSSMLFVAVLRRRRILNFV